eukprot:2212115-Prymnesium_polylepis.1
MNVASRCREVTIATREQSDKQSVGPRCELRERIGLRRAPHVVQDEEQSATCQLRADSATQAIARRVCGRVHLCVAARTESYRQSCKDLNAGALSTERQPAYAVRVVLSNRVIMAHGCGQGCLPDAGRPVGARREADGSRRSQQHGAEPGFDVRPTMVGLRQRRHALVASFGAEWVHVLGAGRTSLHCGPGMCSCKLSPFPSEEGPPRPRPRALVRGVAPLVD